MKTLFSMLLLAFMASSAHAATISMCTTLDASGSVSSTDFTLQKEGLAAAIEDPTVVLRDGSVYISVVLLNSSPSVAIPSTQIDSQATADSVAADIRNISKTGGTTNGADAIEVCANEALSNGDKHILDIVTDGGFNNQSAAETAADNAIANGIEVINALGIGSGVNLSSLERVVRPQPASAFPDPGFAITAADFSAFQDIIKSKLQAELATTPTTPTTPTTAVNIPVFGPFGLLAILSGLFWFGRHRK